MAFGTIDLLAESLVESLAGEESQMVGNYYTSRTSKLLKEFDKSVSRVKGVFVSRYGGGSTDTMIGEARQGYEALIPQLPYIGAKQPFKLVVSSPAPPAPRRP